VDGEGLVEGHEEEATGEHCPHHGVGRLQPPFQRMDHGGQAGSDQQYQGRKKGRNVQFCLDIKERHQAFDCWSIEMERHDDPGMCHEQGERDQPKHPRDTLRPQVQDHEWRDRITRTSKGHVINPALGCSP
jgi:hypothetical protein